MCPGTEATQDKGFRCSGSITSESEKKEEQEQNNNDKQKNSSAFICPKKCILMLQMWKENMQKWRGVSM